MSIYIVNAAPMVIQYGTQDLSTRKLPREPEQIPQHLPKFYLYTQKGPTTPQLVVGNERITMFGEQTFDLRSKYANHATVFANLVNAEGNACMIERVIPDDAGPNANLALWLDVLPTQVDIYERNTDGSIKYNAAGNPIVTGQAPGFKVKWVTSFHSTVNDLNTKFGRLNVQTGDQVDTATNTTSQRYPILEIKASSIGDYGNLCGFRIWAPTLRNTISIPTKVINKLRTYPYYVSMIRKSDFNSTPKVVETIYGEQATTFTLKQNVIDPTTDKQLYIGNVFLDSYRNITDVRYPPIYGDFSDLVVYQGNIDLLLEQFHAAEVNYINSWSDFTADPNDKYLFNILTGESSKGVPYHTFQFVDSPNSVTISEYTNLMAKGGSDGTMNDTLFAQLVSRKLDEYLDENSEVQEPAVNVESIFYDSGFPLETKYKIANFIGLRKDTFVVLSTHDVNDTIKTASEEHSIAVALRTRLQMFPESDYFGTPVMRGMIVGRSGRLRNSQYSKHLPLTAEIAIKSARYMGSGQGRWKNGYNFDSAPGHVIDNMYDINVTWVPASVRNRAWDVGLNWVQAYDRRSYFFPALKTVYSDDTSVLNSYFTAMAICELNKVCQAAWREFTGTSNLTNAQLAERINAFIIRRTVGRFDDRFKIVPETFFTDLDLVRGYSWTVKVSIYSPSMKTVMTSYITAYRMDKT